MVSVYRSAFVFALWGTALFSSEMLSQQTSVPASTAAPVVATPAATVGAADAIELKLSVEPSIVLPGQQYTLMLSLSDATCSALGDGPSPLAAIGQVKSSSNEAFTPGDVTPIADNKCKVAISGSVGKDTSVSKVTLYLMSKATTSKTAGILGFIPLTIQLAKGPGPIPPGLDPGLDLMWKVLPRRAVADSFGNRVADGYFEVEAVFGNETGYDLQLSAVGFDVPQTYCTTLLTTAQKELDPSWDHCTVSGGSSGGAFSTVLVPSGNGLPHSADAPVVPVDSYPVVRATVEREQSVGTRAFVVNLVKGASSVLVGVGGFYADTGLFVRSTGIVAGPFEKALELVYPDLTTNHLINLDTRTLRDGVIVPNNTSFRINAFISRELVQCNYPKHLLQFGFTPKHSYDCVEGDGRLPWTRDFDPKQVMQRLGKLQLIGRKVQYLERVRVLTGTDNLPQSQGGPVLSASSIAVDRSTDQPFTLSGTNLHGVTLPATNGCLTIKTQSVATDEHSIQFIVDSSRCTTTDHPQVPVGSAHGFFVLNVNVVPPTP